MTHRRLYSLGAASLGGLLAFFLSWSRPESAQTHYPVAHKFLGTDQADFNRSWMVDEPDLLLLLDNWHRSAAAASVECDLDRSGRIDAGDLFRFSGYWRTPVAREGVPSFITGRAYSAADGSPLSQFEVLLHPTEDSARSYTNGEFAYEVILDGSSALSQVVIEVRAPGMSYAHRKAYVFAGETVAVDPVYLVPVDPNTAEIGPEGGDYVSSDHTMQISIPPGALDTTVSVTAARFPFGESLPAPLPKTSHFTYCLDRYPDGIRFATDVTTRIANDLGFAPGTPIPVGIYDRERARWVPEGMAYVSADGLWVEYQSDHFSPCDPNVPPQPRESSGPPEDRRRRRPPRERERGEEGGEDDDCENGDRRNSFISSRTGHLTEFVHLPSYRSGGREHRLWLEYASDAAYPNTVIGVNTFSEPEEYIAPPDTYQFQISFLGRSKEVRCATQGDFNRFAYYATGQDIDGNWVDSGTYLARFILGHNYRPTYGLADYFGGPPIADTGIPVRETEADRRHADYQLSVPLLNLRESPAGAGWAVGGLQRLYPDGQGRILLTEGTETQVYGGFGTIDTIAGEGIGSQSWNVRDGLSALEFPLVDPSRLVFDATGDLYVTTLEHIIRFDENWIGYVVAGDRDTAHLGDGGPATEAHVGEPKGMVFDPEGNLIFADYKNQRVRKIDPHGIITTIAGNGEHGSAGDGGPATEAQLAYPSDVALDDDGNLYIANCDPFSKYYYRISRVIPGGTIETYVGGGFWSTEDADGKHRLEVRTTMPYSILVDHDGNLVYTEITDGGDATVHRVDRDTGIVRWIAGKEYKVTDWKPLPLSGPATDVLMRFPNCLEIDAAGNIFIVDHDNDGVWMLDTDQRLSFVVGRGRPPLDRAPLGDGGMAAAGQLWQPEGVALGPNGNLYVADTENGVVRVVNYGIPRGATMEFTAPIGEGSRLIQHPDGTYSRLMPDGTVIRFNTDGLQTHTIDPDGNTIAYEYDGEGNLILIRDPYGLETAFTYTGGRLAEVVDPAGRTTRLGYDTSGNLISIDLPDDSRQEFAYDADHLLIEKRDARDEATRYRYNQYARVESVEVWPPATGKPAAWEPLVYAYESSQLAGLVNTLPDDGPFATEASPVSKPGFDRIHSPGGGTVEMTTDLSGRVLAATDPLGNVTRYQWEQSCANPKQVVLPGGGAYQWEYVDQTGSQNGFLLRKFTDPFGNYWSYSYDENDRVDFYVYSSVYGVVTTYVDHDAAGHVVREYVAAYPRYPEMLWEYDSRGRVTKRRDPEGRWRFFSYDAFGRVRSVTDEEGGVTTYGYDAAGNVASETRPSGAVFQYVYDAMDRRTHVIDPLGRETVTRYDSAGDVISVARPGTYPIMVERDPLGRLAGFSFLPPPPAKIATATGEESYPSLRFAYDDAGNVIAATDALGNVTAYGYDAAGNIVAVTDAGGNAHQYAYDEDGNLASATDPEGYGVLFTHDEGMRLASAHFPDDSTRGFTYNAFSTTASMTNRGGETVIHEYYRTSEPMRRTLPDGEMDTLEYSANGWLTSMESDLVRWEFQYNRTGQLVRRTDATLGKYLEYGYSCCDMLTSISDGDGGYTAFQYDPAGRLTSVATVAGSTTSFEYGTLDSPLREVASNGVETLYTYDELGIVTGIVVRGPGGGTLAVWDYGYDELYLPRQVTTIDGVYQYDYDAVGRIVRVEDPRGAAESYTYDGVGNRTSSSSVSAYRYGPMHRLEGYGSVSLSYDADGNLSTREDGSGTATYTHDAVNRLLQVDLPNGDLVRYGYDSWGFRHYKEVNGATTFYFHAPFLMAEYDGDGLPLRSYTRHPATGEILQFRDHGTGRTYFVHRDALGTPRLLTDSAGNAAWSAEYDSFGNVILNPGNAVEFNSRFLGQYFDAETGLHYNLKRYYDPETCRYIEPDPLSTLEYTEWYMNPSRHEYVYARNNPLRFRDVFGLCDRCDDCPSGSWRGVAAGGDAMLAVIGGSSTFVSMICSNASVRARFRIDCVRIGLGLGLGLSPGGISGVGCNRSQLREGLSGWGGFGSVSLGVVGVSGSHSLTSLGVGTISGGLSLGLEAALGAEHCWVH